MLLDSYIKWSRHRCPSLCNINKVNQAVTICTGCFCDLSPTWSNLRVSPCLSTESADPGPVAASLWVNAGLKPSIIGKGSSTCWVCFTPGLMDSCLCMHVWTSASFHRLASVTTRTLHVWGQDGHSHICPSHLDLGGTARGKRLPRRARRAQWKDVAYCFSLWGNRARAAEGQYHGLIHELRPMTDNSKLKVARDPVWPRNFHCRQYDGMLSVMQ